MSLKEANSVADARIPLSNADLAELLALHAEKSSSMLQRACRRAARAALFWPVEAAEVLRGGGSLLELPGIGPYLGRLIESWIEQPPPMTEPPPLRQNFLTLSVARRILESHPEWRARYRGDLQMHTQWSDGSATIREMAEAAAARGYDYIAITDHSKGLKIAGGITEAELEQQGDEIASVNAGLGKNKSPLRVLRSVELNLNPQGAGDMAADALSSLDLVVGSFHSKLREKSDQMERFLAALRNPAVQILGHPRGRIYNYRIGLSADWPRVFAEAARLGKAVEIDAYADRQDLSLDLLAIARREGTRVAIDTDAHAPEQLAFVDLGLAAAFLAGIPRQRILNFLPLPKLLEWARGLRRLARSKAARAQHS
ncbi:MAG: PHP domain-containing protein [Verrucomicrobiota bacterium]